MIGSFSLFDLYIVPGSYFYVWEGRKNKNSRIERRESCLNLTLLKVGPSSFSSAVVDNILHTSNIPFQDTLWQLSAFLQCQGMALVAKAQPETDCSGRGASLNLQG